MILFIIALLLVASFLSGCDSDYRELVREQPQSFCENSQKYLSPRQIYECFKQFQAEDAAQRDEKEK